MKTLLLCILLIISANFSIAQDTIFLKSGAIIPAEIIEIGDVELKYKKSDQPESIGIYTVFLSDIKSIHFLNGNIVDYTHYVPSSVKKQEKESLAKAQTAIAWRFTLGMSLNYSGRNESDNVRLFWRNINNDDNYEMGGRKGSYSFNLGMGAALGAQKRNWFGDALKFTFTPQDAINASNDSNEIKLKMFYLDLGLFYGHTLNHKKNLMLMFELGIELGSMGGFIKIHDYDFKISGMSGVCPHLATGFDWAISKRFLASVRVGQRFMEVEESHKSSLSKTGYSTFFVDPPDNLDHVSANWSGTWFSFGLSCCFYSKGEAGSSKRK